MADNRASSDIKRALEVLESQRSLLGNDVVDLSVNALLEKLSTLEETQNDTASQFRKFVTVVFADVSGFTTICRTHDAENVTNVINTLWKAFDSVILNNGGTVDKHIGDCVMAVWGLNGVREDDSSRAIKASLLMQKEANSISRESRGLIPPLQIRIGIHSGPVFVGAVGLKGEFTVMGDTVNVASRLQSHAPIGSVLVSRNTWKSSQNDFSFVKQMPITVKGIEEELTTYLVTGSVPKTYKINTSVLGMETAMVGRKQELKKLLSVSDEVNDAITKMVTVVGQAGIGKSRLLHQFRLTVENENSEMVFFNARCTPGMVDIPCSVFRNILRYKFLVNENDSTAIVFEKLENGMFNFLNTEEIHLACNFAGFDMSSSKFIQGRVSDLTHAGRVALIKFFRNSAGNKRTIIYLEDLHWADSVSLDLVLQIVKQIPKKQLLIFCLARPLLLERYSDWGKNLPHTFVFLKSLTTVESRELVHGILSQVKNLPSQLTDLIISNADGNPFYAEELIKMLVEDGVISQGNWTVDVQALTEEKVPSTLTGVLQARLDILPKQEKSLLQMASVVGRVFWDKAVKILQNPKNSADVSVMLSTVERHELVQRMDRSTFSDSGEYLFKHTILRDVTYETVLLSVRKKYHRLIALWFEENSRERVAEFATQIAYHYETGEDWNNAIKWLIRSGKAAMGISAYTEALSMFRRALAAPEKHINSEQMCRLLLDRGCCLEKLCRYQEAEDQLDKAIAQAEQFNFHLIIAESLLTKTWIKILTGKHQEAAKLSDKAFQMAKISKDPAILARAYMRMADFEEEKTFEKEIFYYHKALSIYRKLENQQGLAITLLNMGNVALSYRKSHLAQQHYRDSLNLYEKLGHRWGIANCFGNLGCVNADNCQYNEAIEYFKKSLKVSMSIGDREGEVICNLNMGQAELSKEKPRKAIVFLLNSLEIAVSVGLIPLAFEVLRFMSEALVNMDQKNKAMLILLVMRNDKNLPAHRKDGVEKLISNLMESIGIDEVKKTEVIAGKTNLSLLCSDLLLSYATG